MWTFIFLSVLGLNTCQVSGQGPSTQMHYAVLAIEESAIKNITELLNAFHVTQDSVEATSLKMTTKCETLQDQTQCSCMSNHSWSEELCESQPNCCGNMMCSFSKTPHPTCHPNTRVTINGSVVLDTEQYLDCLQTKTSHKFKNCHDKLLTEMKTVYSTLTGFVSLAIIEFRTGSIIADFEMTIDNQVSADDLIQRSQTLSQKLNSTYTLETAGLVHINVPRGPVRFGSREDITCTRQDQLKEDPVWQLTKNDQVYDITNGTESELVSIGKVATLTLKSTSETWAGLFTCAYSQKPEFGSIVHKASAILDVAHLPDIQISSEPQFPRCKSSKDLVAVKIQCEIKTSNDSYEVTWSGAGSITEVIPDNGPNHEASTNVACKNDQKEPEITCKFTNRRQQNKNATIKINVIYEHDLFCKADGGWADTKAGFTAVLKCRGRAGLEEAGNRHRNCSNEGKWEDEESFCVNQDLDNILEETRIVDIGLGTIDNNAASIFSRLKTATNNTENINTFSNVNASIFVLSGMKEKLKNKISNEATLDNFLLSSSNVLEKSLEKSWKDDKGGELSLAERYLSSVERLIELTQVASDTKHTSNIEVDTCNGTHRSHCSNSVFNVNVSVDRTDSGSVKTTGFKQLEEYFPQREEYEPNSIVVSTTTEKNRPSPVKIEMDFPLLKPRPRNHAMECVSWDNTSRKWSTEGCEWDPSKEQHCVCKHLSSFAIIMSKKPLEVKFLKEITHVGLSVSIISLILCLGVEIMVWSSVVKSNASHLRHTAHINIALCLLIADITVLASSFSKISESWCQIIAVLKHFCLLSMFFWTLCLSMTLLHLTVFKFQHLSKKNYLVLSVLLGYLCPFLIVVITFITNEGGAKDSYYSDETCWLIYAGSLKGSIHTFLIPLGIIVLFNLFTMVVIIMMLFESAKTTANSLQNEQNTSKNILRSVVLLTPIFGVTWIFGFTVLAIDLTYGHLAYVVNYAFTLLNAFQGFLILLTTCLAEKQIRDACLKKMHITKKGLTSTSQSSTSSTLKKK
ncbi:adhesion G protein-coupled receptor F5 isoform X2 [Centroberyx affinis]|uniref:adhesion G protein-coupled receptor F5 isoform X2 n=1 Tax=Centroberyx affinis TaxID=166261 RepID=UPI003A5C70C5